MSSIVINKVFLENDLSVFKIITGNRSIDAARVKKIKESISNIGMIDAPIVCNENMEVIDGQGRLQACRELNKPVPYIVIKGLTIDHCRAMNLNQTNWKLSDYIKSYADEGNINYIRLQELESKFQWPDGILLDLIYRDNSTRANDKVRNGQLIFSEDSKSRVETLSLWLSRFNGVDTNRRRELYHALRFCYDLNLVDNEVLVKKVLNSKVSFRGVANVFACLQVLEDIYNKRARERVWICHEYEVWLDKTGTGIAAGARAIRKNK